MQTDVSIAKPVIMYVRKITLRPSQSLYIGKKDGLKKRRSDGNLHPVVLQLLLKKRLSDREALYAAVYLLSLIHI